MAHLKRQAIPKNWPIRRKGTKFVVKPRSRKGIPLLMVLRNLLKIAQTRKEVKKAIHRKHLLINNKIVKDEKIGMTLFDTLSLVPSKTHYILGLSEKGKFELKSIKENEANKKIVKIIDKKILKGKKIQLNLSDGRNFLSTPQLTCKPNDSILINFKDKKIEKCLPLEEKSNVVIFAGKHAGETGKIEEINKERKMAIIKNGKEKSNILIKQLMVVE